MKKTYKVKWRRRREGKTNYAKRLKLLKSGKARLVFRKSNRYVTVEVVEFTPNGDRVVAYAHSKELSKYGFRGGKNCCSAYLTAFLATKRAQKRGVDEAVFDIGLHSPVHKSDAFCALKGALDAGMNIPHGEECLPDEIRIACKHIEEYASSLSEEERKKKFSLYYKEGIDPTKLSEYFKKTLEKIKEEFGESVESRGEEA
jgi:large subunit ribosomal protein L18